MVMRETKRPYAQTHTDTSLPHVGYHVITSCLHKLSGYPFVCVLVYVCAWLLSFWLLLLKHTHTRAMLVVWNQYQYTSSGLTYLAAPVMAGTQFGVWESGQGFGQAKKYTHCMSECVCEWERVGVCWSVYVWNINRLSIYLYIWKPF